MRLRTMCVLILAVTGMLGCGEVIGPGTAPDGATGPSASGLAPDHGPLGGGNTVSITGTGFQGDFAGDARVLVGGVEAENVSVASDTELTFEAPAGLEQGAIVDVTVFNQAGLITLPLAYRYNLLPAVFTISPGIGSASGGTQVTVTGHGFLDDEAGAATLTIAGVDATSVSIVNDTTLTATIAATPDAPAFTDLDVTVSNANGADTVEGKFRFSKQGLLGLSRNTGSLYWVDPANAGAVVEIGRVSGQILGCATSPGGPIFCTINGSPPVLAALDPAASTLTTIAPTLDGVANVKLRSLAFVGTTLFGFSVDTTLLYSVDTTTGALTAVSGALALGRPGNIAVRDATSVWSANQTTLTLKSVTTAGVLTAGPVMTGAANQAIGSLVSDGTTLYAQDRSRNLFTVNTTTAALTLIGQFPNEVHTLMRTPPSF